MDRDPGLGWLIPDRWAAALERCPAVADLIPVARAARATLAQNGISLTRDSLAQTLRANGHGLSNARASLLTKILRADS
jgi:hypothetical protein